MSRLDDYLSITDVQRADHNSLEARLSTYGKQQIKALMLELAEQAETQADLIEKINAL